MPPMMLCTRPLPKEPSPKRLLEDFPCTHTWMDAATRGFPRDLQEGLHRLSLAGIVMRVCVQSHLTASATGDLHVHGLRNEGVTQEFVRAWGHTRITPARAQCWGFAQELHKDLEDAPLDGLCDPSSLTDLLEQEAGACPQPQPPA